MMSVHRPIIFSIIIASGISLGAYGIYLERIETTATDSPQSPPLMRSSDDSRETMQSERSSSDSAAVHLGGSPANIESFPAREEILQTNSTPVEIHPTGDPVQESEVSIGGLLPRVGHRLGSDAYQDLLRFILDEEIRETGLDSDAVVALEAAITEISVARGGPTDVQSGASDIRCTASLCTYLEGKSGRYFWSREWRAMAKQEPVPGRLSLGLEQRGPGATLGARFPDRDRQGHSRVYMFRPDIEQHRDLLEAVVTPP